MTKVIIDCDPGQDDAIALILALASPELEILGITTVAGNVSLEFTSKNARKICELANRTEIPVYAGCSRPMVKKPFYAEYAHGKTGLDGVNLPEPKMKLHNEHAVDFLINTLINSQQKITLITIGPLTNIALAIIKEPKILPKIEFICCMGGSIGLGNVTPAAEFNFYVDPHAAHVVFESGVKIIMIGLDVTHQALAMENHINKIRQLNTKVSKCISDIIEFYGKFYLVTKGFSGIPIHDACAVAYVLKPDMFKTKKCKIDIEIESKLNIGRSVVDLSSESNVEVGTEINSEAFFKFLTDRISSIA